MTARTSSFATLGAVALALALACAPCRAGDPVQDSFERMLRHEPNGSMPRARADAATDPLIAAVAWPLLRSNQIAVAGLATRPDHTPAR